jgi:hypothetical protein
MYSDVSTVSEYLDGCELCLVYVWLGAAAWS